MANNAPTPEQHKKTALTPEQLKAMGLPVEPSLVSENIGTPEVVASPETAAIPEQAVPAELPRPAMEAEKRPAPEQVREVQPAAASAAPAAAQPAPQPADPMLAKIEEIMTEDLEDAYKKMAPNQQKKFRDEGEVTAGKIRQLLAKTKVKVKKIINLLTKWLKLIPGVNHYFLVQEAKIKADKIIELKEPKL